MGFGPPYLKDIFDLLSIDDLSTAFLNIKFSEKLQNYPQLKPGKVALALKMAQNWLRTVTLKQFEEELIKLQPQFDSILGKLTPGKRLIYKELLINNINCQFFLSFDLILAGFRHLVAKTP